MYWRVGDMFYGLLSIQIIARVRTHPHLVIQLGQVCSLGLVYYTTYCADACCKCIGGSGDISSGLSFIPITARVRTRNPTSDRTLKG